MASNGREASAGYWQMAKGAFWLRLQNFSSHKGTFREPRVIMDVYV